MSVIDMAKAHLQNVHNRIEQLKNQKKSIEDEINNLSSYILEGLKDIEELESSSNEKVEISEK